jgi:hypothetical protein
VLDAAGLSLFAGTGASKALDLGPGPAQAVILGAVTGVGGGPSSPDHTRGSVPGGDSDGALGDERGGTQDEVHPGIDECHAPP